MVAILSGPQYVKWNMSEDIIERSIKNKNFDISVGCASLTSVHENLIKFYGTAGYSIPVPIKF